MHLFTLFFENGISQPLYLALRYTDYLSLVLTLSYLYPSPLAFPPYICIYVYIYIIYTPNLGLGITHFVRKREQGRFKGSSEGALREHGRAPEGAKGRSIGEPKLAAFSSAEITNMII